MPIAQSDPDPHPPRTGRVLTAALRVGVLLYGIAAVVAVYLRLRTEGFTRDAWGHALTLFYVEALSFLAVFGGVAMVVGLLGTRLRDGRRATRRPRGPVKANRIAATLKGRLKALPSARPRSRAR